MNVFALVRLRYPIVRADYLSYCFIDKFDGLAKSSFIFGEDIAEEHSTCDRKGYAIYTYININVLDKLFWRL